MRCRLFGRIIPGWCPGRVVMACAVLACLGAATLGASEQTSTPGPTTIQRSMRIVPRKFVIQPSQVNLPINQTQRFAVIDINGQPVAVRWNLSGLGCYGASCGNIDEEGIYHPPASLPKPHLVTLEGVVVSDPHYSVLTEIRLENAVSTISNSVVAGSSPAREQMPAPQPPKRENLAARSEAVPVQVAIAAAPSVSGASGVHAAQSIPLPSVVSAAPNAERQSSVRRSDLLPVPPAVGTAPLVAGVTAPRSTPAMALPPVVAAAPAVGNREVARRNDMPATTPVAAAPTLKPAPNDAHTLDLVPLGSVVAAAPTVRSEDAARRAQLPQVPNAVAATPMATNSAPTATAARPAPVATPPAIIAAAPTSSAPTILELDSGIGRNSTPASTTPARTAVNVPVASKQVVTTPAQTAPAAVTVAVATPDNGRAAGLRPPPAPATAPTAVPQVMAMNTRPPLLATRQAPAQAAPLQLPTEEVASASTPAADAPPQSATNVTYHDGQLTIDASNATLAEVLKLVAQKIGATIDIPPGTGLERIVEHAGPGTPNEVLTRLLNGSHFNFILVNSTQRPQDIAQVLLSAQPSEGEAPAPVVAAAEPKPSTSPYLTKLPEPPPGVRSPLATPLPSEPLSREALAELVEKRHKEARDQLQQLNPQ